MESQPRADRGYKRVTGWRARRYLSVGLVAGGVWIAVVSSGSVQSQAVMPVVLDPDLAVSTVVSGLTQPIGMAFIGRNDLLVLEKASGKVQRVDRRVVQATPALDLAVNSALRTGTAGHRPSPSLSTQSPASICIGRRARRSTPPVLRIDTTDRREHAAPRQPRRSASLWNGRTLRFERNSGSTARVSGRCRPAAAWKPQRRHHPVRAEPR